MTSLAYGEIDDTSSSAAVLTNTADHQVEIDVTVWDALDNDWEPLQTLKASITSPVNTTLTLADFTEMSDRGTNETHYTTTIDVGTYGRYTLPLSNMADTAGNPADEIVTTEFIVDTHPPKMWNGSDIDMTSRNRVVDDVDTVTVTVNVSDRFLNRVWVDGNVTLDASAFGDGTVVMTPSVDAADSYRYTATFTVDVASNMSDHCELSIHARDRERAT